MSYVIVGLIRTAHGLRGQVAVELLTDEPDAIFAPGRRVLAGTADGDLAPPPVGTLEPLALTVESMQPFKGGLIVKFDCIPDRTIAERWRGRYVLVPADELTPPGEDEVFIHDLVGMAVVTADAAPVGEVVGTYELPQGLTLEIRTARGVVLVPYRPPHVVQVDVAQRALTVDTGTGLFD